MDLDAVIETEYEEFRANRELKSTDSAFLTMVEDAKDGRQFSDIVIEYNTSYRSDKPLKILGGQHRCEAIKRASPRERYHGIRVYFNLDKNKRVELYTISNTNLQVPRDLLDRLNEQGLEPPNKLREFSYKIGILTKGEDFGERKTSEEAFAPTVKMMRTFIVNFYKGREYKSNFDNRAIVPYLCSSGGQDEQYLRIFKNINSFADETDLVEAGKNFVKLHKKQFELMNVQELSGKKEFRMKALSLSVLSSWAYAVGLLQRDTSRLEKLYHLPDLSGDTNPLNAQAMAKAKHPKLDGEVYRGLGTRTESKERGRMLKLFLLYSQYPKDKITLELCNLAIRTFHSDEDREETENAKKKEFRTQ